MASEILKRDENHVTVGGAVTQDSDQDVAMLRVDPVTKYLLVSLDAASAGLNTSGNIAKRDGNHVPVCLGYDETNDEVVEILTDAQGNLLCDITFI